MWEGEWERGAFSSQAYTKNEFFFFLLSKQIPADRATEVMEHSKWWLVGVASKFQSSHGCASFL